MNYLTKTTGALLLAGFAALLGGCDQTNNVGATGGSILAYRADTLDPSALDTSKQTLEQPTAAAEDVSALVERYNEKHAKAAPVAAPAQVAPKPAAPKLDPPLAAKEDIDAAKKRVSELRGSVKTEKNGAIVELKVESDVTTLEDMQLFGRLKDLRSVSFLGVVFTDEYIACLKDLSNIETVVIQNSEITRETLQMFLDNYPNLKSLDIRRDLKLENADLELVAKMPKLEACYAYYNSFSNSGANKLSKSASLKIVDLRGCEDIADSAAKYLARMQTLEEIYFRFNISNDGVANLAAAPNLKFVEFQDCATIDSECTPKFAEYPSLTGLRIFRSKSFDDVAVQGLAGLKLERLELRDLNVSNEGVLPLQDMTTLKTVELSEMKVDAETLNILCGSWKDMTSLTFFSMPVDDSVIATIAANMKGLKTLNLRASSGLTDACIDELLKIETLETLDLRENQAISLEATLKLAKMKNLRKIYAKTTALGDSPEAIAQFKELNPKCAIAL